MYSLPPANSAATKTILRFMSLGTGGVHPLAMEPDIQLDTELPVNLLDVRADVIGDQIVLVLVDLRIHNPESDAIYLVDWKRGRITLVSRPSGTQYVRHGRRKVRAYLRPFPTHIRYTALPTGHTKARSPCSPKILYSSSSATHRA